MHVGGCSGVVCMNVAASFPLPLVAASVAKSGVFALVWAALAL